MSTCVFSGDTGQCSTRTMAKKSSEPNFPWEGIKRKDYGGCGAKRLEISLAVLKLLSLFHL